MALKYSRVFRVRHYECDSYGHVNNTNYLRYILEAGLDARSKAGFSLARMSALGHHWQSQTADIEYRRPVRYGELVEVRVGLFSPDGRTARLAAELCLEPNCELAARATIDAGWIDSASGEQAELPSDLLGMLGAEQGDGVGALPVPAPFADAPPPPPRLFKMVRPVTWQDVDASGRVNDAAYLVYTEDCGMAVVAAHGWPLPRMTGEGFGIVLRRHEVRYLQAALPGDELEIATWFSNVRRVMATRHYAVTRLADHAPIVRANTLAVWIDLATGRPIRIPAGFLADFAPNMAVEERQGV